MPNKMEGRAAAERRTHSAGSPSSAIPKSPLGWTITAERMAGLLHRQERAAYRMMPSRSFLPMPRWRVRLLPGGASGLGSRRLGACSRCVRTSRRTGRGGAAQDTLSSRTPIATPNSRPWSSGRDRRGPLRGPGPAACVPTPTVAAAIPERCLETCYPSADPVREHRRRKLRRRHGDVEIGGRDLR